MFPSIAPITSPSPSSVFSSSSVSLHSRAGNSSSSEPQITPPAQRATVRLETIDVLQSTVNNIVRSEVFNGAVPNTSSPAESQASEGKTPRHWREPVRFRRRESTAGTAADESGMFLVQTTVSFPRISQPTSSLQVAGAVVSSTSKSNSLAGWPTAEIKVPRHLHGVKLVPMTVRRLPGSGVRKKDEGLGMFQQAPSIADDEVSNLKKNPEILETSTLQRRAIKQQQKSNNEQANKFVAKLIGMPAPSLAYTGETYEVSNSSADVEELNEILAEEVVLDKVARKADSIASLDLTHAFAARLVKRAIKLDEGKGLSLFCRSLSDGATNYQHFTIAPIEKYAQAIGTRFMEHLIESSNPPMTMVLNSPLWKPVHDYLKTTFPKEQCSPGETDPAMEWFIAGINLATRVQDDLLENLQQENYGWAGQLKVDGYRLVRGFKNKDSSLLREFNDAGYSFENDPTNAGFIRRLEKQGYSLIKDLAGYSLVRDLAKAGYALADLTPAICDKITCLALDKEASNDIPNMEGFISLFNRLQVLRLETPFKVRLPDNCQKLKRLTLSTKQLKSFPEMPHLEYLSMYLSKKIASPHLPTRFQKLETFVCKRGTYTFLPSLPLVKILDIQDTPIRILPNNSSLTHVFVKNNLNLEEVIPAPNVEVLVLENCPRLTKFYVKPHAFPKELGALPSTLHYLHVVDVGNPGIQEYCRIWNENRNAHASVQTPTTSIALSSSTHPISHKS